MTENSNNFPNLVTPLACVWCRSEIRATKPARYCSRRCRQAAFRLRRRRVTGEGPGLIRGRFLYLDPPYPGMSKKYYGDHPDYGGEVDHAKLIADAVAGGWTGWALSTSASTLKPILALCPEDARVKPWVKPIGVSRKTRGPHSTWEPLIVVGGRKMEPGVRDWLCAQPARGWGDLMGRKPLAFCAFLFDQLGMVPGDELVDAFPGSGAIARAWRELSSRAADSDASPTAGSGRRVLASLLQERREE